MAFADSMFLVEIAVEELKSYINCKEFYIQSQFADVFLLNLKDPNDVDSLTQRSKRDSKKNRKIKKIRLKDNPLEDKVQVGQSILFTSPINSLITTMKNFPIELTLFDKDEPGSKLGCSHIPWRPIYIDYLVKLNNINESQTCVHCAHKYNIYNDIFECVASVKLTIKLTHLKDKLQHSFRFLPEEIYNTHSYSAFISKPSTVLNTIKEVPANLTKENCSIKTVKSVKRVKNVVCNRSKINKKNRKRHNVVKNNNVINDVPLEIQKINAEEKCKYKSSRINYVKSDIDLDTDIPLEFIRTKSCSSMNGRHFKTLNYIFGESKACPLSNQVLCVSYFTVENEYNKNSSKDSSINKQSSGPHDSSNTSDPDRNYKFRICEKDCPNKNSETSDVKSMCSLDLPENAADLITVTKCKQLVCDHINHREIPFQSDEKIQLDLQNLKQDCCDITETVEKVVGEMKTKMDFDKDKCFCSCECTFGFVKHTTYCKICGGYEKPGQDLPQSFSTPPIPCPVYYKVEKKGSGSDKSTKRGSKSGKKKKGKDDRFKFKYGFIGIPAKIGHTKCVMPCTGTLGTVPKNMGWLWNADNVPGVKSRPFYKPGAVNKHVLRLLKIAKNPETALKKKRRESGKPKRPLKRPLLTVAKKDGEYTVTMETMKVFSRPRAPNQHPYEDKPLVTYTIGRTDEENRDRKNKKERRNRRLEREQRTFIQSAFTNMCKEICLKSYQQALGILPHAEDPDCFCYPKLPGADDINLERSCSCSEDSASIGSDTDSDEWIVEFTPPTAKFDPKYKGKKIIKVDNSSQYRYLDYRVKLLDRYGNQVPRFFKGPDGTTQCSDLGGFWSPDHKWLVINSDGYIGPDERWAPLNFIGPNKEYVECDNGKFQTADGSWLVVGVDGYIDGNGKWKYYLKPKNATPLKKRPASIRKKEAGDNKNDKVLSYAPSELTWSCLGDAKPKDLTKLGIFGHGQDKKLLLQAMKKMMSHGEDITIPQPRQPQKSAFKKHKRPLLESCGTETKFMDRQRCKYPTPSDKGVVATDGRGNKKYFKFHDFKNTRPKDRMNQLAQQGISLSSFHAPCFGSFTNQQLLKRQQYEKFTQIKPSDHDPETKCISTKYRYRYAI